MSYFARGAAALVLALMSVSSAFAIEATGSIARIDAEAMVIVLNDGSKFSIPEEFYVEDLEPGMTIRVEYDIIDGANVIADLEVEG